MKKQHNTPKSASGGSGASKSPLDELSPRLLALTEDAPIGIVYSDAQGNCVYVNRRWAEMAGISREEALGGGWATAIHPEDKTIVLNAWNRVVKAGQRFEAEYRLLRPDGEVTWVLSVAIPEIGPHGEVLGYLRVVSDITDQKRVEEAVRDSEARYRSVFDSVGNGIVVIDEQNRILDVNPALCEMFGYSHDELLQMGMVDLVAPGRLELYHSFVQDVSCMKEVRREAVGVRRDGTRVDIEAYGTHFVHDGKPSVAFIVHNITERKRMDEALRESEARYRSIFDTAGDGLVVFNEDGAFLDVNPAYCNMVGYSRDELLEMSVIDLLQPKRERAYQRAMQRLERDGIIRQEVWNVHRDGTVVMTEMCAMPFVHNGRQAVLGSVHDITERKLIMDALWKSEARYRAIFDGSVQGILFAEGKTRKYVYANPSICRMLGYTEAELLQLGVDDIHPKESLDHALSEFASMMRGEKTLAQEIPCLRKDGSVFYADITASRTTIGRKQECLVGFFADVSERRRAEMEIASLKHQMETILGTTRTGLDIIDSDFNIRYIDPEWAKIYGHFKGRKCYEYFAGRSEPCPGCGILEALRTKRPAVTEEILVKENNRPVQVTTIPYQDEKGEWLVAEVNVDITERKQMEEALRRSEVRYRSIFESAGDGIAICNEQGAFLDVNPAYCDMLGYSREELLGLSIGSLIGHDRMSLYHNFMRELQCKGEIREEAVNIRKDGTLMGIEFYAMSFAYDHEPAALFVVRDVTRRRRAEDEAQRRLDSLQQQHDKLIEATQQRAGFFASVSHELRTPLTSIVGFTELLMDDPGDPLSDGQRELLLRVSQNSHRLLSMVNDLLDKAKFESGRAKIHVSKIHLGHLIDQIVATMKPLAGSKNLGIITPKETEIPAVYTDEQKLTQILVNLLSNAIKCTPSGKVTVKAAVKNGRMSISVSDTGIGIDASDIPGIFEDFHRSDHSIRHKIPGVGLGLAITKTLCELLGGTVDVKSEIGKGSTFTVVLPDLHMEKQAK